MGLRSGVVVTVALLLPSPALAQSVEVVSSGLSYPTLTEAIDAAIADDTLVVSAGSYPEDVIVDKNLTIDGTGADVVLLTGAGGASILSVNAGIDLTLSDLSLDAVGQRGITTVDGSVITVERVTFNTGVAGNGGSIQLFGSDLFAIDTTFLGRSPASSGGAIYASGSPTDIVDLTNTTFSMGGVGATRGGAIYAVSTPVTCTDCVISGGDASNEGGAFYVTGALSLIGGSISDSTATYGGAVYVAGGSLTVEGTEFIDNSALVEGGAVAVVDPSALEMHGALFCGNDAYAGGALHGSITISALLHNSRFVENTATSGGAVSLAGTGSWAIDNVTMLGNDSGSTGAVHVDTTTATVLNSLFAHNVGYAVDRIGGTEPVVQYGAFYLNSSGDVQNVALDGGELLGLDPRLTNYTNNGNCADDELWPLAFSPLLDAGHPDASYNDPDGSRNDIGAYGGPAADPTRHLTDDDSDGFSLMLDCDDALATVFPGAEEVCNTIDDDCDDAVDDSPIDALTWYPDADNDTYGSWEPGVGVTQCFAPAGYVADYTDCNDGDPGVNPGVDELCNGFDLNCDGDPHYGAVDLKTWTVDEDLDGHGAIIGSEIACDPPGPDYVERAATDCDDNNPNIHPDMLDACDGIDDNCSGGEEDAVDATPWYADNDGDYHGDASAVAELACEQPAGTSADNLDCDDNQPTVYPDGPEVCDGLDNDCNSEIDDGDTTTTWYPDSDADGFGADGLSVDAFCAPEPTGWLAATGGDCDDGDATVYLGAPEVCDGADNDCDGAADDADDDVQGTQAWVDFDGDGFGDGASEIVCDLTGFATVDGDCNDIDAEINPDAEDIPGNDLDEDCDGRVLEGTEPGTEPPADEPGGCGCSHATPVGGWLVPLLGLALVRRRSR